MTIERYVRRFDPPIADHALHCVHFARLFRGNKPIGTWMPNTTHKHAEHNALRHAKSRKKRSNDRLTMVVVRFTRVDDGLTMSRPCTRCVELMKTYNIKSIVYSDYDGKLVIARIDTMDHAPSSMARNIPAAGRVVSFSRFL